MKLQYHSSSFPKGLHTVAFLLHDKVSLKINLRAKWAIKVTFRTSHIAKRRRRESDQMNATGEEGLSAWGTDWHEKGTTQCVFRAVPSYECELVSVLIYSRHLEQICIGVDDLGRLVSCRDAFHDFASLHVYNIQNTI